MTILITGGTGKTGSRLAALLHNANHPVLIASRSGTAPEHLKGVPFDWLDHTTHVNPFQVDSQIDRVFIVGPPDVDMISHVKPFIDLAINKGVKRFVALSASPSEKGDLRSGKVHEYLVDLGVDYCVLRPSWFFENFRLQFYRSIREDGQISSMTGDGRVGFVAIDDIAEAAFNALVSEKSPNADYFVLGPDLLTYAEVAAMLSETLGRTITHKRLSTEEGVPFYKGFGLSEEYAHVYIAMEVGVANGKEEVAWKSDHTIVGKYHLKDWLEANKATWVVSN